MLLDSGFVINVYTNFVSVVKCDSIGATIRVGANQSHAIQSNIHFILATNFDRNLYICSKCLVIFISNL